MGLLFPGIRPAITNYMTPQAKIFINHCQIVSDDPGPTKTDKSTVVACFYQGPDFSPARPLCKLTLSKIKIDETLIWPVRYWFYRLVSLVENLRTINYKVPADWPGFVFPAPVFEDQAYVNFFSFVLVYLNDFAAFDSLTFDRFKSSLLAPLLAFFQQNNNENLAFNRHLLNFVLTVSWGPNREAARPQVAKYLREFFAKLFFADAAVQKQLSDDIEAFLLSASDGTSFGLGFELFRNIDGEIFIHDEKLYTWAVLSEQIREAVATVRCILIHNFDVMPDSGLFTTTKKRRNMRRCHMFAPISLSQIGKQGNDIFIISTSQYSDVVRCYRLLCPRYLRQSVARCRNKQTPPELFNFDAERAFSFDALVEELQRLDAFFAKDVAEPRLNFYTNTTWQDAFLLLEMYTTSLFINSTPIAPSAVARPNMVKVIDASSHRLEPNKYSEFEVNNLLNIYNFHVLVAFLVWYLVHDKRNIALTSAWQPSLLNLVIYDLWAALVQQNCNTGGVLSRLHSHVKSLGQLQIRCSRALSRQLALGPYRSAHDEGRRAHKRLAHTYQRPLALTRLTNFSIDAKRIVDYLPLHHSLRTFKHHEEKSAYPVLEPAAPLVSPSFPEASSEHFGCQAVTADAYSAMYSSNWPYSIQHKQDSFEMDQEPLFFSGPSPSLLNTPPHVFEAGDRLRLPIVDSN